MSYSIREAWPEPVPNDRCEYSHWTKDGKPKRSYTMQEAIDYCRDRPHLRYYYCEECNGVHVGKMRVRKR